MRSDPVYGGRFYDQLSAPESGGRFGMADPPTQTNGYQKRRWTSVVSPAARSVEAPEGSRRSDAWA